MSIVKNIYFKNEIYIPDAKPSISDDLANINGDLDFFVKKYEKQCLIKTLGRVLYTEFYNNLDESEANFIKAGSDAKWDLLLNGGAFVDSKGNNLIWNGVRFKTLDGPGAVYDGSFIAYYIYNFFERNDYTSKTNSGTQINESKNSFTVVPTLKVTNAWREFVRLVHGDKYNSANIIFNPRLGYGIDYYNNNNNEDVSLYYFIEESNLVTPGTYENFSPNYFKRVNSFGI